MHSTAEQCKRVEAAAGGPKKLAAITGSRCVPCCGCSTKPASMAVADVAFVTPQGVRAIHAEPDSESQRNTPRRIRQHRSRVSGVPPVSVSRVSISHVGGLTLCGPVSHLQISSAVPSVLCGEVVGIDYSDGSGMNLLDIRSKLWAKSVLEGVSALGDVDAKLGKPVPSASVVGRVHKYFVDRYGVNADCAVTAGTGDNPSSVAGLGLVSPGDVGVSLGTSDTVRHSSHCSLSSALPPP